MKAAAVPVGMSWMWTLAFGYHEDGPPSHGYAATREAAMAAFAKRSTIETIHEVRLKQFCARSRWLTRNGASQ